MEIVTADNLQIDTIVDALRSGKTIVYPTETCYGLGCDATQQAAVDRVFEIKERQKDKPLLVVMSDVEMCMDYVEWDEMVQALADTYWPGPLTIVARALADHGLADGIIGPREMLAFRVTDHPLASELCARLGKPLVSTSANIAAQESPYDMETVVSMFAGKPHQPDIIIDAGALPHRSPSTVVRVWDGQMQVLRQGEVVVKIM